MNGTDLRPMYSSSAKWDRHELYQKVWEFPLRKLAEEYGISDVGLAKVCRKLHIPLPGLGHWTKIACGHVWQSRYYSCPVDEPGVWPVMSYIERNPVRAGLVEFAEDYVWSSARSHVIGRDQEGFLDMSSWSASYTADRWRDTLQLGIEEEALRERLRLAWFRPVHRRLGVDLESQAAGGASGPEAEAGSPEK